MIPRMPSNAQSPGSEIGKACSYYLSKYCLVERFGIVFVTIGYVFLYKKKIVKAELLSSKIHFKNSP